MTLDEAIKHAENVADYDCYNEEQFKCSEEHRQLAEWLRELKRLREQTRWIPVSERLPGDREEVLVSTKTNEVFEGSYFDDNTNRQWYSCRDEAFTLNNVVTAWMPLPEPYKEESEDKE